MSDPYLIDLQPGDDEITRDIVIQRWLKNISDLVVSDGIPSQAGNSGKFLTTNGSAASWSFVPISTGVSGLGTGVATALAVNIGTAGAPVVNGGALGTPSSGVVTNLTGTASININGTVGATTPAAGTFTSLVASSFTNSGLTATRVPFASTGGLLADSSAFTFITGTGQLTATSYALGLTTPGVISGASGAITLTGAGTNQNITLTPSGTGVISLSRSMVLADNASNYFRVGRFSAADAFFYITTDNATAACGIRFQVGSNIGTSTALELAPTTLNATFSGAIIGTVQALSGAGAVNVTQLHTDFTSTGGAQALTLANGTAGQFKTICHVTDGGSGVLTPTTKTGFTTITFTNVGDSVTLRYSATGGWYIVGLFGAVAA